MKTIYSTAIFIFTVLITRFVNAQDHFPVRTIDPSDINFHDLMPVKSVLKNCSMVLLGEQTHGEATTFEAKIRLIKYLHEEMGFDVLAFESGFYDCADVWKRVQAGANVKDAVKGNLFYMYADSKEMLPLFEYLQQQLNTARPLELAGFESQHTGAASKERLFDNFKMYLDKYAPNTSLNNWDIFKSIGTKMFGSNQYLPSLPDQKMFFQMIDKLLAVTKKSRSGEDITGQNGFWYEVTRSLASQAKRYWKLVKGNELSVRDLQMANNLTWLANDYYKGKKIIVWAHNIHIAKETKELNSDNPEMDFLKTYVPMGTTIKKRFGKKAYMLGFVSEMGTYMNYVDSKILSVPGVDYNTINHQLALEPMSYNWFDYTKGRLHQEKVNGVATLFDFITLEGKWNKVFDGWFFIRKAVHVTR